MQPTPRRPTRMSCPIHGSILKSKPGFGVCPTPLADNKTCPLTFPTATGLIHTLRTWEQGAPGKARMRTFIRQIESIEKDRLELLAALEDLLVAINCREPREVGEAEAAARAAITKART